MRTRIFLMLMMIKILSRMMMRTRTFLMLMMIKILSRMTMGTETTSVRTQVIGSTHGVHHMTVIGMQ